MRPSLCKYKCKNESRHKCAACNDALRNMTRSVRLGGACSCCCDPWARVGGNNSVPRRCGDIRICSRLLADDRACLQDLACGHWVIGRRAVCWVYGGGKTTVIKACGDSFGDCCGGEEAMLIVRCDDFIARNGTVARNRDCR